MTFLALILPACVGFWLGRRWTLFRQPSAPGIRHEWAAYGQGASVHAPASFRPHPQGGHSYQPSQMLARDSPGRIYLHSPP